MAVVSWSSAYDVGDTFYVNITTPTSITASGPTTAITLPSLTLKANSSYYSGKKLLALGAYYSGGWAGSDVEIRKSGTLLAYTSAHSNVSGGVAKNTYAASVWASTPSVNTSRLFDSTNNTDKTVSLSLVLPAYGEAGYGDSSQWSSLSPSSLKTLATINVTLNVPPTVTLGTPTYVTPQYAGLGAYTVPITSAEAYYGGDISKVTLTVGQDSTEQTYSAATISNKTISVIPTIAGTYTPTITVEDSRGQTKTETLPQIVVNPYLAPSLDFDVFRSNSSGVRDDEGAYGLITANVSFTDAIADLTQPTVKINGTTTNNVTWYSAYNASTGVSSAISDWSTVSSGDTIYGLINGSFAQTDSYQITVILTDSLGGNSSEITQTLSTAFYTIDFQAGGKEIAFGAPANDNLSNFNGKDYTDEGLFKCNMGTAFNDMTAQEVDDFVDGLNYTGLNVVDYIVDQGTNGIWIYRKWNSGIAECWGEYTFTSSVNTLWVTPIYVSDNVPRQNYPFTFVSVPMEWASISPSQNACWLYHESNAPNTTAQTSVYKPIKVNGFSSNTFNIRYYVMGRWR